MPRDPSLFAASQKKSPRLGLIIPGVDLSLETPEVAEELLRLWNHIVKEYIEVLPKDMTHSELEAKRLFPVPLQLDLKLGEHGKPIISTSLGLQKMGVIVKAVRQPNEVHYQLYAHAARPAGKQLTEAVNRIAATCKRHNDQAAKRLALEVLMLQKMRELHRELADAGVVYFSLPQLIGDEQVAKPIALESFEIPQQQIANTRFREPIKFITKLHCTQRSDFH